MAGCWSSEPMEKKNLRWLLGSTTKKDIAPCDMKLFELALLCMPHDANTGAQKEVTLTNYKRESDISNCDNQGTCTCMNREEGVNQNEGSSGLRQSDKNKTCSQCISKQTESMFIPKLPLPKKLFQQTFNMWKARMDTSSNLSRIKKKKRICIQPLDDFPEFIINFKLERFSFFELLSHFAALFFLGIEVDVLPTIDTAEKGWNIKSRYHHVTKEKQLFVKDLYTCLNKIIPKTAYCVLGISWTDLYPSEELNFVLGEASGGTRTAVFSFGRFEPKAYKNGQVPPPIDSIDGYLLWKMIKVLSHETCHIFGLSHCVFFECAMNESTSLPEALGQPLYLCPICLRKLHKVCKFNLRDRCQQIAGFLRMINAVYPYPKFVQAAEWYEKCLHFLQGEILMAD